MQTTPQHRFGNAHHTNAIEPRFLFGCHCLWWLDVSIPILW